MENLWLPTPKIAVLMESECPVFQRIGYTLTRFLEKGMILPES